MKTKLHYETSGRSQNPPLLFLHGFMGRLDDWRPILESLQQYFFCIAVDLPGHGRSIDLTYPNDYSMEGASRLLGHVLDALGIENAHVVGYSMGGRLALYYAVHFPRRCRRVVLESASPGLRAAGDRRTRVQLDERRAARLESGDFGKFLDEWYRQPLFSSLERREDLLERMIASRSSNAPAELARSLRAMGTGVQPTLWRMVENVHLPILVVAGALDGKFVEIAEQMAVLMPNIHTAIIPNAGHIFHAESPDAFADLIKDFLKKPLP